MKARVTVRPPSKSKVPASTPASPEPRQRALTALASEVSHLGPDRRRNGSFSLHHQFSSSSLSTSRTALISPDLSPPSQSPIHNQNDFPSQEGLRPIKVKAKVSGLAKSNAADTSPVSPTLSLPPTRLTHTRSYVSASHIQIPKPPSPAPPENQFYPITTAVPSASPYRFASTRHSPPNHQHQYRPFLPSEDSFIGYGRPTFTPKTDLTSIALPPQSPPTSTVSFSSHSSLSYNTEASADLPRKFSTFGRSKQQPQAHTRRSSVLSVPDGHTNGMIARVDAPFSRDNQEVDGETDGDSDGSEHKVKAEAKSNRKVFHCYLFKSKMTSNRQNPDR